MTATVGRTGIRFVLANCSDPTRTADFDEFYDAYAADCTRPGWLINALRYTATDAAGTDEEPTYLSVYDIVAPNPGDAWPPTLEHQQRRYPVIPTYFSTVLAGTYGVVSCDGDLGGATPGGAMVMMSRADEAQVAAWAEECARVLTVSGGGRVSHLRLIDGWPGELPKQLVLVETASTGPALSLEPARVAAVAASGLDAERVGIFTLTSAFPASGHGDKR